MRTTSLTAALAVLFAFGAGPMPSAAVQIAEVRGDFYYDSQGELVGHRHADLPDGLERRPMSHQEKFRLMGLELPAPSATLAPRTIWPKPLRVDDRPELSRDRIIVKFVDDLPVRLRGGALRAAGASLPDVEAVLARYPEASLHRLSRVEERILEENRESGERISGKALADLNNLYVLTFDTPSERGVDLANELLALDVVEVAYLQAPGAAPGPCADVAPATPNWEPNQTHLDPAPLGLDADYAKAYHPGGDGYGSSYWVADLEWDWCFGHEDLPTVVTDVLNGASGASAPDHGTAVLGIVGACNNGYGMTGITPDVQLKMCDFDSELTWAANIQTADAFLLAGEIMLLEIHILGPSSGLSCPCNCPQFEYVPVEWDIASFLAIQTATANGIIVVEAGGNGSMDLDSPIYGGWFTNASGAIVVGAGQPGSHSPECWTDYGSRIDVHGWGSGIFSTGYADLWWGTGDCTQDYTSGFGGTSGASPMIVGASAALQGIAKAKYGVTLSPGQVLQALQAGGTPQGGPYAHNIGVMPNLVSAIDWIEPDVVPWITLGGWSYPLVARSTGDANPGYAPLDSGPIPGNTASTYWNWTEGNPSYSFTPTVNDPKAGLFVDDWFWWVCNNWNLNPGETQYCINAGPNVVKGGRHTILNRSDVYGVEDEWSEANDWARQFIWSGLPLATDVPVVRTYDPPRISTGYGPYYNAEGFSGSTASYWTAFAVLPTDPSTDDDVYLHSEFPWNVPQQGFGAAVITSSAAFDLSDFVIVDTNVAPWGTYWASSIAWSGTGNKAVECDSDQGTVPNPGTTGPYELGAGEIVDLHEVWLNAGVPTRIHVQWLYGAADYGVSLHQSATGFSSKWSAVAFADNAGPGEDEWFIADRNGWHGIAVWKRDSGDLNLDLGYNLIVTQALNLTEGTPAGWYGPIVPRNTTDATVGSAPLPSVLYGNQTTTSYCFATLNQGPGAAPAVWYDRLAVDDAGIWIASGAPIAQGTFLQWINTPQGLDPQSLVRGGRHHLRLDSDAFGEVPEALETDNTFVDWFSWTPLALAPNTGVTRLAGPPKDPLGYGPDYSCDGFSSDFRTFWTAVGVLPTSMAADYDVRTHNAYVGSKDGFNSSLDWSGDAADGAVDFAVVNYNVAGAVPDFSVLNWNATASDFTVERAEAFDVFNIYPGAQMLGPFGIGTNDVLAIYEMWVSPAAVGLPVYVSILVDDGDANVGAMLLDGTLPYHNKFSSAYASNSAGPGGDEHLPPIVYGAPGYNAIVVHKTDATDLPRGAYYRIAVSVGGPAVDAPSIEAPPSAFALEAPRPNPFGAETSIRYDVPAGGGRVSVAIFDVSGRRVATLAEGELPAGRHAVTWQGKDAQGARVGSGVYFVRLESATVKETKRIVRMR